jgi:hypothetical protein
LGAAVSLVWAAFAGLRSERACAFMTALPSSLAQETLSETVPTAFPAFELSTEDYSFEWLGPAPTGVELKLLPGTIQWVRVADVLVLPRARLLVEVARGDEGRVSNSGFSQSFAKPEGSVGLRLELPVALVSGETNAIDVAFKKDGELVAAKAVLRFKPRAALGAERVFTDASCSRFGLRAEGTAQSAAARGWAYIGCRVAEVEGKDHRTSSLEAWVYWDGVGQSLLVGGAPTPASTASVWPLRLRAEPGRIQLAVPGGGDEMTLRYSTPENFHRGFIGMGLGPYWERFMGNTETFSQPSPVVTLYGSYFLTETLRLVSFDATNLDSHWTTDVGVYVNTEYLKFLDRRVVINLLLGAHAIGFNSLGQYYFRVGVPQGVEILFLDFLKKGCNLNTGFFIYPLISGTSYYNVWLRWGSGRIFGEFNYISWDQTVNDQPIHSDSVGVSVGIPLARFL